MKTPMVIAALAAALALTGQAGAAGVLPQLPGAFDPTNPLARVGRGEIPAAKLFEDDHTIAILLEKPSAEGHFIVFSKRSKATDFMTIEPAELERIYAVARRVAAAEMQVLGADGFIVRNNNGSASILHQYHLHVIPRSKTMAFDDVNRPVRTVAELQPLADRIRAAMRGARNRRGI